MAQSLSGDVTSLISEARDPPPRTSIGLTTFSDRPKMSLQHAARDNREDVVRIWLSRLPKYNKPRVLDQQDRLGYSAMHYAAKFNRFKIMTLLVTSGASSEIKTDDEAKLTPLHFAARYIPRYQDEATEQQEAGTGEGEQEVTYLSSSKQAMKFFVTFCRVDVNAKAQYGITPLHLACQRGNLAAVQILLENDNIDITASDDNKDTPLHEAAQTGIASVVEAILQRMKREGSVQLQLLNDELQTPLHIACREGHTDIVKLILQYGFDQRRELVSAQDNEYNTPLHLSCESGNDEIVRVLLLNGADLYARKIEDISPIHIACKFGYVKVVDTMLGAEKDIIEATDIYQRTPLHFASQFNQDKMIDFLLDKGADIYASNTKSYTAILTAAHYGQVDAFKKLRMRGAPVDVLDNDGKSCIFLAAEANHVAILKAVMRDRTGAKLALTPDASYNTPLHIAAAKGNLASLRVLLDSSVHTAKLDAKNEVSKTALHLASSNGHPHVVLEIIRKRPDTVFDEDEDGNSPLHLACLHGNHQVAKSLVVANADVEARNATLWTPMDCAANKGHQKLVELLIDAGADVDPTDKLKTTPLQLSAQEGHLGVVNVLLENNADAGLTDQNGFNALDHAIQNGHEEVALAIVQSSQWSIALRNTTVSPLGGVTTPLRKLIRKMPEVAEEVFNRCTYTNATKDGKIRSDSRDYRVTFQYEFLEDFQDTESKTARLSRALKRTFRRNEPDEDVGSDVVSVKTDSSPPAKPLPRATDTLRGKDEIDGEIMDYITGRKVRGFKTNWGPIGFQKSIHPLSIMVAAERTDLLTHPLVTSLLNYKWKAYGRFVYFTNLVFYAMFLIALTSFALLLPNPLSATCRATFGGALTMNMTSIPGFSGSEVCNNDTLRQEAMFSNGDCGRCDEPQSTISYLYFSAIIVIICAFIRLVMELFQFLQLRLQYIIDWVNWVEITLFVCSIIFAFVFFNNICLCPFDWQWQVGAIAVFLAWIDLIIFIRKLPLTGIYVLMFVDIFYTFCKMIVLTLLLVIAFAMAFYMAFFNPVETSSRDSFSSPLRAIWKTATMTTGEFEFDNLFRQNPGGVSTPDELQTEIGFPVISFILWLVFLVLMPILLTNLLVGLAVDDIKGIQEAAALKRLALQVELALSVEELFPWRVRRWFIIGQNSMFPNRDIGLFGMYFGVGQQYSEKIDSALNPQPTPIEQVSSQTRTLVHNMQKMKETMTDLAERNAVLEKVIKQMALKQGIDADNIGDDGDDDDTLSQI